MAYLIGQILGIIILIFGIILVIGIIRYVSNFDYDAPFFKIDITISTKSENEKKES